MEKLRYVYRHYRFPKSSFATTLIKDVLWGQHGEAVRRYRALSKWEPTERGGYTQCLIYNDLGELLAKGLASCSPRDNFNYRIGRAIARGRAEKALTQ